MTSSRSGAISPIMSGDKFRPISNDDLKKSAEQMLKTKQKPGVSYNAVSAFPLD